MNDISVVTHVKNRAAHLDRLLAGVRAGTVAPREIVIVDMSDEAVVVRAAGIPTRIVVLSTSGLPLAAARNSGASAASGRHLLFLDVDCIPQSNLVAAMCDALEARDDLICAEVRYLGPDARDLVGDAPLFAASVVHPHRDFPAKGLRTESNAGLFWSLLFGVRRDTFFRLDGFDEGYEGYGAEDTDFGFRAHAAGLPLTFMGGTGAFHQYHGVTNPPLQHFADIVRNANRFHARWRVWPMREWLASFERMGLIARSESAIVVLRTPTTEQMADAAQPPSVYF